MSDKIYVQDFIFQPARKTSAEWQQENPILRNGEFGVVSDGTETEWLKVGDGVTAWNSLPFKKGPKGDTGAQGIQGIQGEKGEKGEKGDRGDAGYTPVKGVDYFTADDIASLNIPEVDRTYNPQSLNAQSGIAVAEAADACSPAIITTSGAGKAVNISDSAESLIKGLSAYGESSVKYIDISENLISYPFNDTTKTVNGITFTDNGDGTITANGTATASVNFVVTANEGLVSDIMNKTMRLSGCPAGGSMQTYWMSITAGPVIANDIGNGQAFTLKNTMPIETYSIMIYVFSGKTVNNLVFSPSLVEVEETKISVENPVINVYGKNLIPYPFLFGSVTKNGVTFTDNADGTITVNGTATANTYYSVSSLISYPKGTYYLSGSPKNGSLSTYYVAARNRLDSSYTIFKTDTGNGVSITLENADTLMFDIRIISGATVNNLIFKPQLEFGSASSAYELYNRQTVTVPYTFSENDALTVKDGTVKINISGEESDITDTETGKALLALKTNYPSTSVISDIDLDITYKADTKNYIDNKINERLSAIEAALLNNI